MTIFREIVEAFLIEGIENIKNTSTSYDHGTVNFARGLTMFGRDLDLSAKKRTRLDSLITEIQALAEAGDAEIKIKLLDLISQCKIDLLDLCLGKKHPTGSTELAVMDLYTFVTAAYEKICGYLHLIDVPTNDKSINKLKFYSAKICGRSVYEMEFIKDDITLVLDPKKEKIILDTLDLAERVDQTINAPKANKFMEKEHFRQLMTDRAEFIQREVQKIDQQANNAYVIDYLNKAIEFFKPPQLIPETTPVEAPQTAEEAQLSTEAQLSAKF